MLHKVRNPFHREDIFIHFILGKLLQAAVVNWTCPFLNKMFLKPKDLLNFLKMNILCTPLLPSLNVRHDRLVYDCNLGINPREMRPRRVHQVSAGSAAGLDSSNRYICIPHQP